MAEVNTSYVQSARANIGVKNQFLFRVLTYLFIINHFLKILNCNDNIKDLLKVVKNIRNLDFLRTK